MSAKGEGAFRLADMEPRAFRQPSVWGEPPSGSPPNARCPELEALAGPDKTLPAGMRPHVPAVWTLLDVRDPEGERMRVEEDRRDGRAYLTIGEPSDERPFELLPGAQAALQDAIDALPCGHEPEPAKPVQQVSEAGKPASVNGRPMSLEDNARSGIVAQAACLLGQLPIDDLKTELARLENRGKALAWGDRARLPTRRRGLTRSAVVGGTKVHVRVDAEDGGEARYLRVDVAKVGAPVRGLLDVIAGLASIALQHGAPVAKVAAILSEAEFAPAGAVTEADEEDAITSARSIPHYVAQVLMLGADRRAK